MSCDLAAIQPPGGYRTADGDAAGLPAGTTLHSTPGLPVWFRLVTSTGATYEARPQEPTVGGDELPLRGLVTKIGVYSARPYPAKPLLRAEVTDPAEVRAVVHGIVTAPLVVRGIQRPTGSLRFWLADGTYVERTWSRSERLLDQWIPLSADVLRIISPDPPG